MPSASQSRPRPPRRRQRTESFDTRADENTSSRSKKVVIALLILLSLFLVGTVIVLSTVRHYFGVPSAAFLDETEVQWIPRDVIRSLKYNPAGTAIGHRRDEVFRMPVIDETEDGEEETNELDETEESDETADIWDVDGPGSGGYWMRKDWDGRVEDTKDWTRLDNVTNKPGETIPRLIHQTWKTDHLPEKWRKAWKECREGMPDYEYMLWTDDTALDFVKTHYPHYVHMFENYKYPIMRADAIRYFILHHFGGIYMDLDIGCRRRLDPLLQGDWDTILPITKPVGVSNDLIFSAKGSAFMDHTVHALPAWDHDWLINYPTVMFSTGPMFLSGQYAIYSAAHPITESHPSAEVRVLPKSLYGKNVPAEQVPHSFFSHFYGSSWHAEDANFVTFLGKWGKILMYIGLAVLVLGIVRLIYTKIAGPSKQYQALPVLPQHSGSATPVESHTPRSFSPPSLEAFTQGQIHHGITGTVKRIGGRILAVPAALIFGDRTNRRRQGLLHSVPGLFQPAPSRRGRTASEASQYPMRRSLRTRERERLQETDIDSDTTAPPPYDSAGSLCSSPEPLEKKLPADEYDGYFRSGGSSSSE